MYHHLHSHQRLRENVPHHHRPHCLMPSERDTAMMDEAYALYGYHHDMVRVDPRPPPSYAVAVRSSRQCPAAAAATASSTSTQSEAGPSSTSSSNRYSNGGLKCF